MWKAPRQLRAFLPLTMTLAAALAALFGVAPRAALAAVYRYVDWTSVDVSRGTAAGTITLPDSSVVAVNFAAINPDGSPGHLYSAQIDETGINYWQPSAPFVSQQVENAPPGTDILQLAGGDDQVYKVMLSEPIRDPMMAIVSLGASTVVTTYHFDSPFTIVSQGAGYWGGTESSLVQLPGNVLEGTEGHGTIRFLGTFATFAWTVPTPETWHGFTFAVRTTLRLEPPDAAGPDTASDGGAGGAGDGLPSSGADVTTGMETPPPFDAPVEARPSDGARSDAGTAPRRDGCDCSTTGAPAGGFNAGVLPVLALLGRAARRRARSR